MAEASSTFRSRVMDAFIATESRLIPRNVREFAGPLVFSSLIGTLRVASHMMRWYASRAGARAGK